MKNCKFVHHKLSPGAAIWLRVLMTMVYNGHQAYVLLKSYDFLMDVTKCTSFKEYMQYKNKIGTFADYCRECIKGITNLSGKAGLKEDCDDSSVEIVSNTKRRRRNVRDSFFTDENKVSIRRTCPAKHLPTKIANEKRMQYCCVWCWKVKVIIR